MDRGRRTGRRHGRRSATDPGHPGGGGPAAEAGTEDTSGTEERSPAVEAVEEEVGADDRLRGDGQQHWARWFPQRYSQIPDPKRFFAELGRQVELEIADLALQLEGPSVPGETYLEAVGRMDNARMRAREMILPEQILLPPEPGADPDEEEEPEQHPPMSLLGAEVVFEHRHLLDHLHQQGDIDDDVGAAIAVGGDTSRTGKLAPAPTPDHRRHQPRRAADAAARRPVRLRDDGLSLDLPAIVDHERIAALGPRLDTDIVARLRRFACPTTAGALMLALPTDANSHHVAMTSAFWTCGAGRHIRFRRHLPHPTSRPRAAARSHPRRRASRPTAARRPRAPHPPRRMSNLVRRAAGRVDIPAPPAARPSSLWDRAEPYPPGLSEARSTINVAEPGQGAGCEGLSGGVQTSRRMSTRCWVGTMA